MTLQQLYYALCVAEKGSINKAAETLFIAQPSLTNSIHELEKDAGITIFSRTRCGAAPTEEGAEFLMYARQLYGQYEILCQKYGENGNIKRKFGVSTQHYSFAVKAFVETVKRFDTKTYDFAIRETQTSGVINDVGTLKSDIGILYLSNFNRKIIEKMFRENKVEYYNLIKCGVYVYLWKNHPLANEKSINLDLLKNYPCLSFEQGEKGSLYLSEEFFLDKEYPRIIKACDRATMLNLMVCLNGYTLCSGIICSELNGDDYIAVPFEQDNESSGFIMEIGYIIKKHSVPSKIGEVYINEVKRYLKDEINVDGKINL